jgi:rhamnulokinase
MTGRAVRVAAVDLGAASGRVMAARIGPDTLDLTEVHRFANRAVPAAGTLYWDVLALYRKMLDGLALAGREGELHGIGVDSWAVDYGLIDAAGALLGNPVSYRDTRTDAVMERVLGRLGAPWVYATTGVQNLPFNTLFQLVSAQGSAALAAADKLLLLPDLFGYWLTGAVGAEVTNASTTQLLDAGTRDWSAELVTAAGLRADLLPPLRRPGARLGELSPAVAGATGLGPVPVFAVGSHDTASAVVGVPAAAADFAYISSGTWSLVGVELDAPVRTEASRAANFSNEAGVDGTVRYLRNVMGLWLLQECVRTWSADGSTVDLEALLAAAAREPMLATTVDPDRPDFLAPTDMPDRIAEVCRRTGRPVPATRAATVRCILDSLALAHRRAVRDAQRLSDRAVSVVHIVGGGARNGLLCQLTADACGLPVVAGPVEATAWGNALVQARALGAVHGGLSDLRARLRTQVELVRYEPAGGPTRWDAAERATFAS